MRKSGNCYKLSSKKINKMKEFFFYNVLSRGFYSQTLIKITKITRTMTSFSPTLALKKVFGIMCLSKTKCGLKSLILLRPCLVQNPFLG